MFGICGKARAVRITLFEQAKYEKLISCSGIPISNICYDNADTRFSLVASFSGLDGDLSKPPFPNGVSASSS